MMALGRSEMTGADIVLDTASASTSASAASSATTDATAGFVLTTINGQRTTLQVAVPTGDATATPSSTPSTAASSQSAAAPIQTGIQSGTASLLACQAPDGSPVCLPGNGTLLNTGDTYYGMTEMTW
jgi:hypothetical protein